MLERTITQNSALYLAQHRTLKRNNWLFRHKRVAKTNPLPDLLRPAFGAAYLVPRFLQDNGR